MGRDIDAVEVFKNGDFNVIDSDEQSVEHVLMLSPGELKSQPLIGVGIMGYINSDLSPKTVQQLDRSIRLNLKQDGAIKMTVKIDSKTSDIYTTANY